MVSDDKPIYPCPNCETELDFDEVDIGVGTQIGNFVCPECGWTPPPLDTEESADGV